MHQERKKFEKLAQNIQKQLSPEAKITHDEKIKGRSGILNQCDVVIRAKIGTINFLGIIECKDHSDMIGVEVIRGFKSKLDDINAMKGIIVSSCGFTKDAHKLANELDIDLFIGIDGSSVKWNKIGVVPLCVKKVYLASCEIKIFRQDTNDEIILRYQDGKPLEGDKYHFYDHLKKRDYYLTELAQTIWDDNLDINTLVNCHFSYRSNKGRFSLYEGENTLLSIIIEFDLEAKFEYFYNKLNLAEGIGYYDEKKEVLHSKEFLCPPLLWKEAFDKWPCTDDSSKIPFKPFAYLALVHYFSERKNHGTPMFQIGGGIK